MRTGKEEAWGPEQDREGPGRPACAPGALPLAGPPAGAREMSEKPAAREPGAVKFLPGIGEAHLLVSWPNVTGTECQWGWWALTPGCRPGRGGVRSTPASCPNRFLLKSHLRFIPPSSPHLLGARPWGPAVQALVAVQQAPPRMAVP